MELSAPDILVISLGTTAGLRRADEAFAQSVRAVGASCEIVPVEIGLLGSLRRAQPLIDLVEAVAARRTTAAVLKGFQPRAIVFSTVTVALLQPRWVWRNFRTAIRFDCPAALNRPGNRNFAQHRLELRALACTDLALPMGAAAAHAAGIDGERVLPIPLDERFVAERRGGCAAGGVSRAVAYGGGPDKRGLDLLCRAWPAVGLENIELQIVGIDTDAASKFLDRRGVAVPANVEFAGMLAPAALADLLASSRVFVNASRWEDYGMTQLEALAAGAVLATVPTPGPYEALPIARQLAPELVAADMSPDALAVAVRSAFELNDDVLAHYREAAWRALADYRPAAVEERLRNEILPALLGS